MTMKIGDRCFVHGYVDEIRKDTVIVKNSGGYFGTSPGEVIIVNNTAHPNWIPCSERLPENEYETYWVCTDTGYQCECRWTNVNPIWTALTTDWHWNIFDTPQYTKVVAWMPLPEPYKGGDK